MAPLALAFALGAVGPAGATGTLDQQQTTIPGPQSFNNSTPLAQTFTAGLTGTLDQVDLALYKQGTPGDLVVEIRSVSGGSPTGTVLASQTMPEAGFPTSASGFDTFVAFTTPAHVTSGMQYAIVLSDPGCTPIDLHGCLSEYLMQDDPFDDPSPYPSGRLLRSSSTSGPWSDVGGGACTGCVDAGFKTYVTVPTAVELTRFSARRFPHGVSVTWRTANESRLAGFSLWRSSGAGWQRVNRSPIVARHGGQPAGASYTFVDRTAPRRATARYRLQLLDPAGKARWFRAGAVIAR